jgi:outer membrane receptor protein involved in Fe transport
LLPAAAHAEDDPPPPQEIIVYGRNIKQIGIASSGSEGIVGYADFEDRPLSRVGELAENVPGLIATQHSGEGKANQYFLRGFNLDHGTDLAGFVDGAPINMRSHGHGQGYLDLNFLIPELVEKIDYTKGPYHAAQGDFASAGSMAFTTKTSLPQPLAEVTGGSYGYWRGLAAGSVDTGAGSLLAAVDGTVSDGPWVLDERLRKLSLFLKYSADGWSLGLSGYTSRWQSTDQVPERAIGSGLIPWNGTIDPYLGGRAGRIALTLNADLGETRFNLYAIGSRLELTSNFTYFLDDPINGDEFRQRDRRGIFGGAIRHEIGSEVGGVPVTFRLGADARADLIGTVGLYHTVAGIETATVRQDSVDEFGGGLYGEAELALSKTVRLVLGLRGDAIGYHVRSDNPANSGSGSAAILTPKAALAWRATDTLELYANYGEGYHSNDVRGATINVDPASGDPVDRVPVFVRSRGAELGARYEKGRLTASLVGFWLDLASELVFIGDAGTTEPNAASRRFGGEFSLFWKPTGWLTIDAEAALTHSRFRGVPDDERYIPNAVPSVLAGGISIKPRPGIATTLRLRHFGSAPLIEDNSQRSESTTILNLGAYWEKGRFRIGADMLNLFNAHAPDISYFYASRLPGEPAEGIEDRHIHPVEPRQVRVTMRINF